MFDIFVKLFGLLNQIIWPFRFHIWLIFDICIWICLWTLLIRGRLIHSPEEMVHLFSNLCIQFFLETNSHKEKQPLPPIQFIYSSTFVSKIPTLSCHFAFKSWQWYCFGMVATSCNESKDWLLIKNVQPKRHPLKHFHNQIEVLWSFWSPHPSMRIQNHICVSLYRLIGQK